MCCYSKRNHIKPIPPGASQGKRAKGVGDPVVPDHRAWGMSRRIQMFRPGLELEAESIKVIRQTKDLAGRGDSTARPYLWYFLLFWHCPFGKQTEIIPYIIPYIPFKSKLMKSRDGQLVSASLQDIYSSKTQQAVLRWNTDSYDSLIYDLLTELILTSHLILKQSTGSSC